MRNLYRLILTTLALFCPALTLGQVAGNFQSIAISGAGRPLSNINVAVCSGLSTTAAAVSGNVATLTMSANPISTGFQLSGTITVYQFSGADAYFNGTFTITNLNSTQIQFALTHANASAGSNGNVVQQGGSTGSPCLPLTTLYTDSTGSNAATNPFQTDGLGNVSFWAAPQTYEMQYYGGGLTTTMKAVVVSCVPGNSNCGITAGGNIAFSGNNTHSGTETFNNSSIFNAGGTFGGTWLGTPILSALWTFNGGFTSPQQVTVSSVQTTDTSVGALIQNTTATTTQRFVRMFNTGGSFYVGIESSVGGFFFTGSNAYESVLYTPTNNLFINTPLARFQGNISVGSASVKAINNVQYCDGFSGATADVQINACIAALPANGGTADARGFGATSQTIAATVTVGTNTKTVTLLLDRTTTFNCTITNNTPCFKKGPGSAMIGMGSAITNPNAGITFSASAAVSAAIFDQQQSGGNFVGSYLDGISIFGNATMTVSDALVALQCPLQVTNYKNLNIAGLGLTNSIMLKIYGTTACGGGNVDVSNTQIECSGATGCKPVWIGCASAGSTTLVACPAGIGNMSFNGKGSAYVHPGSGGIPIFDIECGNGAGGTNTCGSLDFAYLQLESRNAGDIGILANGPESFHVYGLTGTCAVSCGADLIRVAQPAGTTIDGVDIRGIDNQGGWTNTLNNTVLSRTFAFASFPRLNYSYAGSNRVQTVIDGGPQAMGGQVFTTLGTPANGTFTFCSDCTIANPCAGAGSGALAKRLNGVWVCN